MEKISMRLCLSGLILAWLSMVVVADVNVLYHDPPGGWSYSYLGEGDTWGGPRLDDPNEDENFTSLDGSWDTQHGLEQWDHGPWGEDPWGGEFDPNYGRIGQSIYAGTPADPLPNDPSLWGPAPGGVFAANDNDTTYLRVQDTGDPQTTYGWEHTEYTNTNKKFNFVHDISNMGMDNLSILDDGITISFRARLSTAAADPDTPLDNRYPTQATGDSAPPWPLEPAVPVPWAAEGDGEIISQQGNGHFGVCQSTYAMSSPWGCQIGFSLALQSDLEEYNAGGLGSGLIMNDNQGSTIADNIETNSTSTNIYPIPEEDLIEWNEFWITIEEDTSNVATHVVSIYRDGEETPMTFYVTGSRISQAMVEQYYYMSYLQMAHSRMWNSSAIDIDFFSFREGIITPTAAGIPGDFDFDGDVDGSDFLVWQQGGSPDPMSASDLAKWDANFGTVTGTASTAAIAIPEPAAFLLSMIGLVLFRCLPLRNKNRS